MIIFIPGMLLSANPEVPRETRGETGGQRTLTSVSPRLNRSCHIVHPADEVVISMCPVSVFAKDPDCENEQSHSDLRDRWR